MEPLILSSSSLKLFRDCRKAYQLGYVKLLDPLGTTSEAVEEGSSFHEHIAMFTENPEFCDELYENKPTWTELQSRWHVDPMNSVAAAYVGHKGLPEQIVAVERPFYVKILPKTWVRCTFDLVYRDGGTTVIRDYKTFEKSPSLNLDLDFQGRFYIACGMKHFGGRVDFEYEYVRRELWHKRGGVPDFSNPWEPEERYLRYALAISDREAAQVWAEAQETARDIRRAMKENRPGTWYHNDKKGWAGCESCFYRRLCDAENQQGALDEQTIASLSVPREPLSMEMN